ncbi:MAG: glycosyltransferase family 1 protein [Thermaerobacter sp.]|nr:glycosyltransferase family 1 protein [Thermaerobacter sp.]
MTRPLRVALDLAALGGEATGLQLYPRRLAEALDRATGVEVVLWKGSELAGPPTRVDLVHHPLFFSPRVGLAHPLVVSVHDLLFEELPEEYPPRVRRLLKESLRRAVAQARRVLAPSQVTAHELRQRAGVAAERIAVVPLAPTLRPPNPAQREQVRARYALYGSFFLHLAGAFPRKNLSGVLEAWRRLPPSLPCRLLMCCPRDARRRVAQQVQAAGLAGDPRLVLPGYLTSATLAALMDQAVALLYPSRGEGFGLPVLEAMSLGTPVIASRIPVLREVGGDAVAAVDPADPVQLAAAMLRVLEDPRWRGELAERGRARARGFSWERTARETCAVYRAALD